MNHSEIVKRVERLENKMVKPEYITILQMGKMLGISRSTLHRMVHSEGFYPAIKLGKRVLINKKDLEKWLDERRINKEG